MCLRTNDEKKSTEKNSNCIILHMIHHAASAFVLVFHGKVLRKSSARDLSTQHSNK